MKGVKKMVAYEKYRTHGGQSRTRRGDVEHEHLRRFIRAGKFTRAKPVGVRVVVARRHHVTIEQLLCGGLAHGRTHCGGWTWDQHRARLVWSTLSTHRGERIAFSPSCAGHEEVGKRA